MKVKVGLSSFSYCTSLTSINIPSSVTVIQTSSFSHCTALTDITVYWDDPSVVNCAPFSSVFLGSDITKIKLHVPVGKKALYEASNVWYQFNIVEDAVSRILLPTVDDDDFISCEYYTLSGIRLSAKPATGFYIERATQRDGSVIKRKLLAM